MGPALAPPHHGAGGLRRLQRGSGGLADRRGWVLGASPEPGSRPAPDPARSHRALRLRGMAGAQRSSPGFAVALRLPRRRHLERRAAPGARPGGERQQDRILHGALAPPARSREPASGLVTLARAPATPSQEWRARQDLGSGAGRLRAVAHPLPGGMTDRRMRVARSGSTAPSGPSAQVAYHPELGNGGRVGKRLALTGAAESALAVQREGRTVGGRDPETK